jgi:hypothetical protein
MVLLFLQRNAWAVTYFTSLVSSHGESRQTASARRCQHCLPAHPPQAASQQPLPAPLNGKKSATIPSTLIVAACDRIATITASTRSYVRPYTYTCAPSIASAWAMAHPIPAVDPVTNATLFVSFRSTASSKRKATPSPIILSDRGERACRDAPRWRVLECADLN